MRHTVIHRLILCTRQWQARRWQSALTHCRHKNEIGFFDVTRNDEMNAKNRKHFKWPLATSRCTGLKWWKIFLKSLCEKMPAKFLFFFHFPEHLALSLQEPALLFAKDIYNVYGNEWTSLVRWYVKSLPTCLTAEVIYEQGNEPKESGKQNETYHSRSPHENVAFFPYQSRRRAVVVFVSARSTLWRRGLK